MGLKDQDDAHIPSSQSSMLLSPAPKSALYRALFNLGKSKLRIKLMTSFPPQLYPQSPDLYQWSPTSSSESGESFWSTCLSLLCPRTSGLVLFAADVAVMSVIFLLLHIGLPTFYMACFQSSSLLAVHPFLLSIPLPLKAATP